jgi:hypothetical protein
MSPLADSAIETLNRLARTSRTNKALVPITSLISELSKQVEGVTEANLLEALDELEPAGLASVWTHPKRGLMAILGPLQRSTSAWHTIWMLGLR